MTDRSVRRRRLVLVGLVVISLILITAAFGSGGGGGGGGPLNVLGHGASSIAKPVRDAFHWFGDTRRAKSHEKQLRAEVARLRKQNATENDAVRRNQKLQALLKLPGLATLRTNNDPVAASVIIQNPSQWALRITIDKGTADGVREGMAVIGSDQDGAGLVGKVTGARSGSSIVTLLPDPTLNVGARVGTNATVASLRGAGSGTTDELRLDYTLANDKIVPGHSTVITSGTVADAGGLHDWAPPGIPIGLVTGIDNQGSDDQVVHLRPYVDMRQLEDVVVLRRQADGNRAP